MNYSQLLLERTASWLADNFSGLQLESLFRKYRVAHLYSQGTNKYKRTLASLGQLANSEEAEPIMRDIWERIGERLNWKMLNGQANKFDRQLLSALRAEGYEIVNGKMIPAPPLQLMAESVGHLQVLLHHKNLLVAEGHLIQAVDNYQRGNWAACNAQLRALLEEICNVLCVGHSDHPNAERPPTGGGARKRLEAIGLLSRKESEFVQSWFSILHTEGAHPGLSSQEDTRWRLYVTVSTSHWMVMALDKPGRLERT